MFAKNTTFSTCLTTKAVEVQVIVWQNREYCISIRIDKKDYNSLTSHVKILKYLTNLFAMKNRNPIKTSHSKYKVSPDLTDVEMAIFLMF